MNREKRRIGSEQFGHLASFVARRASGTFVSDQDFRGKVTILLRMNTVTPLPSSLETVLSEFAETAEKANGGGQMRENYGLQLFTTQKMPSLPLAWSILLPVSADGKGVDFLKGANFSAEKNMVLIFDHNRQARLVHEVAGFSVADAEQMRTLVRKLVTDQSMAIYLSKRTFFGPRKETPRE